MKFKTILSLLICLSLIPIGFEYKAKAEDNTPPLAPTGLMMEHSNVPLGIEADKPAMSWIVNDIDNNEIQTAYRIMFATTLEKLNSDNGDVWDSGKVESSESSNALYDGQELLENTRMYWKVKTWDKNGAESPWSEPQLFSTAVGSAWEAQAIWADYDTSANEKGNVAFLRKEFTVNKPVERAIASAIGKDVNSVKSYTYKLYLNGSYSGAGPTRGIKDNVRTEVYDTFDVTDKIQQGVNCVSAINYSTGNDKRFQMQIKIYYTDGTSEVIKTDNTWKGMDGTFAYGDDKGLNLGGHPVMAEYIDNRVFPLGFDEAGFNDDSWKSVDVKDTISSSSLYASPIEPMNEVEMPAQTIAKKSEGNYFIQLEKEIIGGLILTLPDGINGQEMTILYGEELESENTVKWQTRAGNNYKEVWTMRDGAQKFQTFGVKNFRYIEIQNCPVELTKDMIKGIGLQQAFDWEDSSFVSSNEILNEVWELCKYTIKASNQNMYVDSLTRERLPYEGDNYVNQLTSFAVSRNYNLPRYSNRYILYNPTWPAEYRMLAIQSTYNDYMYTGETSVIEEYYDKLKQNLLLSSADSELDSETGLLRVTTAGSLRPIIDYPAANRDGYDVDNTPYNTVVNSYEYYSLNLMADMAEVIGKSQDAAEFRQHAEEIREAIFRELLDKNDGFFIEGLNRDREKQTGKAFATSIYPLLHNLVTDEIQQKNLADFIADGLMEGDRGNVYTAQFLLQTYYKMGKAQAGMDILSGTGSKSWYNMIHRLNATMTTEKFDFDGLTFTFSHPWSSSAANVMVRDMMGVQPLESAFNKIQIKPQTADLKSAELTTPSIKGGITVKTAKDTENSAYELTTILPANTTGVVYVPADAASHNIVIVDGEVINAFDKREDGFFVFDNVGSGTHTFVVPKSLNMTLKTSGILRAGITTPIEINGVPLESARISASSSREDVLTVASGANGCKMTLLAPGRSTVTVNVTLPEVEIGGIVYQNQTLTQSIDIKVEDSSTLKYALGKFSEYEPTDYTTESYNAAKAVVDEIAPIDASGQYTDDEAPEMVERLNRAYAVMKPVNPISTTGKNVISAEPSTIGRDAAWDGSIQTIYEYGRENGGYTSIDLGSQQNIAVVRFYTAGSIENMIGGRFEGSNDNWTWSEICTVRDEPIEGWNQLPVYAGESYRYVRYTAPNYSRIAEIELYSGGSGHIITAGRIVAERTKVIDTTDYSSKTTEDFQNAIHALESAVSESDASAIKSSITSVLDAEKRLAPDGTEYNFISLKVSGGTGCERISVNGGEPMYSGETVKVVKGSEVKLTPIIDNDIDYSADGWIDINGTELSSSDEYILTPTNDMAVGLKIKDERFENLALGKSISADKVAGNDPAWSITNLTDGQLDSVLNNLGYSSGGSNTNYLNTWVQVDLGQSTDFNRIQLYPRTDMLSDNGRVPSFPEDFEIQISNDGTNYTTVSSYSGFEEYGFAAPEKKPAVIQYAKTLNARYVRIVVECIGDKAADDKFYLQISEIGIYNVPSGIEAPLPDKIKHKWSAAKNVTREDELMPGLFPCDNLSFSKDNVVIDGKSFEGRISSDDTPKGNPINQGAALKYTAPSSGELTIYCKSLGQGKVLQIDQRINGRNETIAQFTNSGSGSQNVSVTAKIEKGVEYYLYVPGSKGQFAGVEALLDADETLIPDPDATPKPTATPSPFKIYKAENAGDFYASDNGQKPKLSGSNVGYLYNRQDVYVGYSLNNVSLDGLISLSLYMASVRYDNTYVSLRLDSIDGTEIANQIIKTGDNDLNLKNLSGITGAHKIYLLYIQSPYDGDAGHKYLGDAGDLTGEYIMPDIEVSNPTIDDRSLKLSIANNSSDDVSVCIYVAQYDKDGIVINTQTAQDIIYAGTDIEIMTPYIKLENTVQTKLFVWDENLAPYCKEITL